MCIRDRFNSGILFFLLLIILGIAFSLRYTIKNNKPIANLAILCFAFTMLGFSSYSMVVIRSIAEPAIDMNDPQDAESLLSYINREQYGSRPLLFGPYYNADLVDIDQGKTQYRRGKDSYEKIGTKQEPKYDDRFSTVLPRMGDMSEKSRYYPLWNGMIKKYSGRNQLEQQLESVKKKKPTFSNNMKFMFKYQLGWMYWRYFMWNFAGRQNDIQNVLGNSLEGNWISGIKFLDEWRLGVPQDIPVSLKYNKARNTFFFLPLILGILGIIVMYQKSKMDFYTVLILSLIHI